MSANTNTVNLADGRQVCFSYGVPVAAFVPGRGYLKTDRKYSVTTSRHANTFCGVRAVVISHEEFLSLIAPIAGER